MKDAVDLNVFWRVYENESLVALLADQELVEKLFSAPAYGLKIYAPNGQLYVHRAFSSTLIPHPVDIPVRLPQF